MARRRPYPNLLKPKSSRSIKFLGVKCFTLDRRALRDIAPARGLVSDLRRLSTKDSHMFSKTLIAALIVASAAFAVTTKVNAGPVKQTAPSQETLWIDRASTNYDGGGY